MESLKADCILHYINIDVDILTHQQIILLESHYWYDNKPFMHTYRHKRN